MSTSNSGTLPLNRRFSGLFGKHSRLGQWLQALDRILRGDATRPTALRGESIDLPAIGLSLLLLVLAVSYGVCMGMYSGCRPDGPSAMQWLACAIKVPALFFLTLLVTFPSLYVFNALVGSRLQVGSVWQLLLAALAVNLAVLASLGPIVAFFSFSTTSSAFMVLLNVAVFALSGILGMVFLLQTLQRLSVAREMAAAAPQPERARPPLSASPETAPRSCGAAVLAARAGVTPAPQSSATTEPLQPPEERPAAGPAEQTAANHYSLAPDDRPPYSLLSPGPVLKEHSPRALRKTAPPIGAEPGALDSLREHVLGRHVKTIFVCWMLTFGVVGGQMAWVLRPFFASSQQPFVWFAPRGSNFFQGVLQALFTLFRDM